MVSRSQLLNKLRELGFEYKRRAKRVEIYKRPGSAIRVAIPMRKEHDEHAVRLLLDSAGASADEIDEFIKSTTM